MEEFIVADLARIEGIESAAILDGEGFVKFSYSVNNDKTKNIAQLVDLLNANYTGNTTTVITDKYVIIIQKLQQKQALILLCSTNCNMGAIRDACKDSVNRLDNYIEASSR